MIELTQDFKKFVNVNFEFVESQFEDAVDIYSSEKLKLRIIRDRNTSLFIDISTMREPQTPSDWISMGDLRSYMMGNDDYLEGSEFMEVSQFFRDNYNQILSLLNTEYDSVLKNLRDRGNHRAELKWGPISEK